MKRKFYFVIVSLIFFIFSFQLSFGQVSIPQQALDTISANEMLAHVKFLASDEMMGRDTPSPELDSCAVYIGKCFFNRIIPFII